jgi:hypothetical protein
MARFLEKSKARSITGNKYILVILNAFLFSRLQQRKTSQLLQPYMKSKIQISLLVRILMFIAISKKSISDIILFEKINPCSTAVMTGRKASVSVEPKTYKTLSVGFVGSFNGCGLKKINLNKI